MQRDSEGARRVRWWHRLHRWWIHRGLIVVGDDYYGWSAKYKNDRNWVWAMRRETAIHGAIARKYEKR